MNVNKMYQTTLVTVSATEQPLNLKLKNTSFSMSMLPDDVINHIFQLTLVSDTTGLNNRGFEDGLRQLFHLGCTQKRMHQLYTSFMRDYHLWELVESTSSLVICNDTDIDIDEEEDGCSSSMFGLPGVVSNAFYSSLRFSHSKLRTLDLNSEHICEHLVLDILSKVLKFTSNISRLKLNEISDNKQLFNLITQLKQLTYISIHNPTENFLKMMTDNFQFLNVVELQAIDQSVRQNVCQLIQSFNEISSSPSTLIFNNYPISSQSDDCVEALTMCLQPPPRETDKNVINAIWKTFLCHVFELQCVSSGEFYKSSNTRSYGHHEMSLTLNISLRKQSLNNLLEIFKTWEFIPSGMEINVKRLSE